MMNIKKIFGKRSSSVPDNPGPPMSIFGSIAGNSLMSAISTGMDFIPVDREGHTMRLNGNVNPSWLGLSSATMQYFAYRYCSPLASVIDRLGEADTNGIIKVLDEDGVAIQSSSYDSRLKRVFSLLKKPNGDQNWLQFNTQQEISCKIYGYCPVLAISPFPEDMSYSTALYNLDVTKLQPVKNDNYDMFDPNSRRLKGFWITGYDSKKTFIDIDYIMIVSDGYMTDEMGLPISKVAGLDYAVSNIIAAMEADNVLLKKKGPLGVFSFDPKADVGGWQPMTAEDKDELQQSLSKYGLSLGQLQYVISKMPMKWNPMSFNVRDLMTKETIRQSIEAICDRFGYPAELMSGKNATYENRHSAERFLYQSIVIPYSSRVMECYNSFFEVSGLSKTFNHLTVLQDDIQKAGNARLANSKSLEIDWNSGIITFNEYRIEQGLDAVPGMDIYISEYNEKFNITKDETSSKNTGAQDESGLQNDTVL